jgi:O-succinylbenzoic acid--CoA ligase
VNERFSLFAAAAESPRALALVGEGREIDFAAAADFARRAITWFRKREIRPGGEDRVALLAKPDVQTLLVVYALIELGVPIVFLHPRLTDPERERLIENAAPRLVIDDVDAVVGEMRAEEPGEEPRLPAAETCLAILYTSGTTGAPKGAMLSRSAFLASAAASAGNLGWQDDDRWLLCMPVAHVGGLSILVRCLVARRPVVVSSRFDVADFLQEVERRRVTIVSLVPTMLQRILDQHPQWRPPPHLRVIFVGGAATSPSLLERSTALALPVLTTYGMTETCSQITAQRCGTSPSADHGSGAILGTTELRIVEDRIHVRGPSLMMGYFPLGASSSPFLAGGWFASDDFGRLDDQGRLHVLGRRQELIITGGENVYPAEIEQEIERLPQVRAACVFGIADVTWGEIVCAAIVLAEPEQAFNRALDLDAPLALRLATHKRPRRIAVVGELSFNATGKLDRRVTRALAERLLG